MISLRHLVKHFWKDINSLEAWVKSLRWPCVVLLSIIIVLFLLLDIVGKIPSALHIDFVIVSATLGGLIFAGASLSPINNGNRIQLMGIANRFIFATVLFLIFVFFFGVFNVSQVEPKSFEISWSGAAGRAMLFWITLIGLIGGSFSFSSALIDWLTYLLKASRPKTPPT